mmetsp:Transcript_19830/g.75013  ORF Transcript_19830/g.75013 Transcript_19830/m.75013 type:complete len:279 (+) Transcript_19830:3030-3866(+)
MAARRFASARGPKTESRSACASCSPLWRQRERWSRCSITVSNFVRSMLANCTNFRIFSDAEGIFDSFRRSATFLRYFIVSFSVSAARVRSMRSFQSPDFVLKSRLLRSEEPTARAIKFHRTPSPSRFESARTRPGWAVALMMTPSAFTLPSRKFTLLVMRSAYSRTTSSSAPANSERCDVSFGGPSGMSSSASAPMDSRVVSSASLLFSARLSRRATLASCFFDWTAAATSPNMKYCLMFWAVFHTLISAEVGFLLPCAHATASFRRPLALTMRPAVA